MAIRSTHRPEPVTVSDKPGHQGITATYSSVSYNALNPTAYFDPNVGPVIVTGTDTGSWSFLYSADQALCVDPSNPKRSYGLFTNPGVNDAAVELFYNIAVTPWFRVTPDIRFLIPAHERTLPPGAMEIDNAVVFGLRGKIGF